MIPTQPNQPGGPAPPPQYGKPAYPGGPYSQNTPLNAQPQVYQQPPQATVDQHLAALQQWGGLVIKQQIELFEAFTGFETENRYDIFLSGPDCVIRENQLPMFRALEKSDCFQRQCCGPQREFNMSIFAMDGTEVMKIFRPFKCTCCCCNLPELHISTPDGQNLGKVLNIFQCCGDHFDIMDNSEYRIMTIHGECCQPGKFCHLPCEPFDKIMYEIQNTQTSSVGSIKKVWAGFTKAMFTDADTFTLTFPPDATLQMKQLLLGAVFLIDFMYFENNSEKRNN